MDDFSIGAMFGAAVVFLLMLFLLFMFVNDTRKYYCEDVIANEIKKECKIISKDCWCTEDQTNWINLEINE